MTESIAEQFRATDPVIAARCVLWHVLGDALSTALLTPGSFCWRRTIAGPAWLASHRSRIIRAPSADPRSKMHALVDVGQVETASVLGAASAAISAADGAGGVRVSPPGFTMATSRCDRSMPSGDHRDRAILVKLKP